jgi:hypothetical protein
VVDAVAAGQFRIYAAETVDQVLELLTGVEVGSPETENSLDWRVVQRLEYLARLRRKFGKEAKGKPGAEGKA